MARLAPAIFFRPLLCPLFPFLFLRLIQGRVESCYSSHWNLLFREELSLCAYLWSTGEVEMRDDLLMMIDWRTPVGRQHPPTHTINEYVHTVEQSLVILCLSNRSSSWIGSSCSLVVSEICWCLHQEEGEGVSGRSLTRFAIRQGSPSWNNCQGCQKSTTSAQRLVDNQRERMQIWAGMF